MTSNLNIRVVRKTSLERMTLLLFFSVATINSIFFYNKSSVIFSTHICLLLILTRDSRELDIIYKDIIVFSFKSYAFDLTSYGTHGTRPDLHVAEFGAFLIILNARSTKMMISISWKAQKNRIGVPFEKMTWHYCPFARLGIAYN